jgi:hypothetical protein
LDKIGVRHPRSGCRMPFLRNGFIRQCFAFQYYVRSSWLHILFELFHWVFLLMAAFVLSL